MEPLYIAVCEDQPEERQALLALLESSAIPCVPAVFATGEELLTAWRPHTFDLLLMDIYMDGMTGIETVKQLRSNGEDLPVAFVTSSTDHALDSYRLSALKYIEKPVTAKALTEILALAQLKKADAPALIVQRSGSTESLRLADIVYLEQQGHVVNIHLQGDVVKTVYDKLAVLAQQLDGRPFFQTHKSFLVHLAFIDHIDAELRCFVLTDGKNIPIRRELMGRAKRAWQDFLIAQIRVTL